MKRVEDFETFCVGDVWFHRDNEGNVKVSIHNEKTWLTPDDWAEVEQKIRTVDVHSPGRRLYEARQAEASKGHHWSGWDLLSDEERDYHERVAVRLGIKPEGES